ncbi:MIF4G domain containing protein [Brugia malayi]|uniref:Bm5135, isoform d n=3 Tax=Brugia malayi TaxID=6279 RepID=A0A1P6C4D6_BRUMA|nr:MIF4G domain containing protein [Brugia malayi]CDP99560.1 Bm5135, isoform d [Brugia malayi]VIO94983.1 MIF4G domain containing protein [Brugia malayi]
MSSGNPRGKPRRNGSIPGVSFEQVVSGFASRNQKGAVPNLIQRTGATARYYGGQHIVSSQMPAGVLPPAQPTQPLVNGNAGQPPQQPISFAIPSVDSAHPPHTTSQYPTVTRMPPRNLPNPSMQFAAGEAHVEGARPQQGNHQITIHTARYQAQPVQTQQNYPASQLAYPPSSMYNSNAIYSAHNFIPNNPQSFYYPPVVAPVYSYFPPAQPADYINPAAAAAAARINVGYNQNPFLMQVTAAATPPTAPPATTTTAGITGSIPQQPPQQLTKTKRILSIVDPTTNEVTNKDHIIRSEKEQQQMMQQNVENADTSGKRGPSSGQDVKREQPSSFPSNASQKFTMQVAQSVLGGSNAVTTVTSTPPPTITASSLPAQTAQNDAVVDVTPRPSTSAPPVSTTISPSKEAERSAPPELSADEVKIVVVEVPKSVEENDSTISAESQESDEGIEQDSKQEKEFQRNTEMVTSVIAKDDKERDIGTTLIIAGEVGEQEQCQEDDDEDEKGDEEHQKRQPLQQVETDDNILPLSIQGHSVVEIVHEEEAEKDEKFTEVEESPEAMLTRKKQEYTAKQKEMLKDENVVNLNERVYGHDYLCLIRDIVKDVLLDSVLPVKVSDLKELGIDIASAPANGTVGDRQRRFDSAAGAGARFIPGWVDKSQSKPKAYHGRLSDRTHSNQRERDRKRPAVSRPSIDRPNREPVKLHKAENAWKPERNIDANQKLYKSVRSLLNKLTPSTFDELSRDFLRFEVYKNKEQMGEVINIIFDKAVEEPNFCALYSDLCKMQVVKESKESKDKSKFRSALLTRCQNTFEEKRMSEINNKKIEMEKETDEKKKRELKIELMEMEARERRRMLGNIGFIGQLFRHELIVPRILNWCIVHLLKNHSESPDGDEESIECAVKMLESVGKLADRQCQQQASYQSGLSDPHAQDHPQEAQKHEEFNTNLYFEHLNEVSTKVSNRVRFLILNLIELRDNKWVPRTSESGPKTLEEVHDEARREEMANRLQREQYANKKRYEGRTSLDKRNQRPVLIGRQSQDGRQYGSRVGEPSRDQKARAAGAANLVANTASRKNQTLNSVDQPQSLGARRPPFAGGAIGGGQQMDRSILSRGTLGRGAGRGSLASRDNSQPSSREPSESRKSRDEERSAAIAAASAVTHSASSNALRRGYAGIAAGGSSPPSSIVDDEIKDGSQGGRVSEVDEKEIFGSLYRELHEYFSDASNIELLFQSIMEIMIDERTMNMDLRRVRQAFRLLMKIGVEKTNGDIRNPRRRYVGQVICRCLQRSDIKGHALRGVADYCTQVVEMELWEDNMRIWECVAEVISWSIMCEVQHFEGPRPSLGDFKESFKNADADSRKPYALLVSVLKRLVEIEHDRDGQVSSTGMAFDEIKDLHSDSLVDELKSCQLSFGKNLYQLLLN